MVDVMAHHEFTTVGSELLMDAPILAVRRDEVVMPGGNTAYREVVEHMGAVAVVAVNADGNIAMVRQYRHSVGQRLWELPAGLLDVKGEDPVTGARRELAEEAGVSAHKWGLLTDLVTSPGFCEETVRVFLAQELGSAERLQDTGDEEADMDVEWVPLDKARDMIFRGDVVNSIAIAGIFAASEVLAGRAEARPADAPFELRPTSIAARRPGPDLKAIASDSSGMR